MNSQLVKNNSKQMEGTCNKVLGQIFKQCLKPLFHLMTVEIPQYYAQMEYTKCLNTAIIFTFMIGNMQSVEESEFCEVRTIKDRYKTKSSTEKQIYNQLVCKNLISQLKSKMNSSNKKREFFYILLTNGQFKREYQQQTQQTGQTKTYQDTQSFPGHVFIIEKYIADNGELQYAIYQSYITHYDASEFGNVEPVKTTKNGKLCKKGQPMRPNFNLSKQDLEQQVLEGLKYISQNTVWDKTTTEHWCNITHTSAEQFEGTNYDGEMIFCFKKFEFNDCMQNFRKFLKQKLNFIDNGIQVHFDQNEIYGKKYLSQQSQLQSEKKQYTYGQMRTYICKMLKNLNDNLNIKDDTCIKNNTTLKRIYNFEYSEKSKNLTEIDDCQIN